MSKKSEQAILSTQTNFRDLGGFTTKSGQKIKENSAFRSGFLGALEDQELFKLSELNVQRIIDLRTVEEIELTSKGSYPAHIEYVNIPLNAGNISKFLIPVFQKGAFNLIEPNLMDSIYMDLITKFTSELATVYRQILTTDQAVLFHCSHGKDRTGVISALLLDLLDVDRTEIYADYLKSNELLEASNAAQMQRIKQHFEQLFKREVSEEEFAPVHSLFYCHEKLLALVFDHVDNEFGSIRNYFQSGLGLSEQETELLRTNYLEEHA